MQAAKQERSRDAYRPTATSVAEALHQAWTSALEVHDGDDVLVPASVASDLKKAAAEVEDPWGHALRFAFATDPKPFVALSRGTKDGSVVRLATFRSAGEDGAFETYDDIVWKVMADGTAHQ